MKAIKIEPTWPGEQSTQYEETQQPLQQFEMVMLPNLIKLQKNSDDENESREMQQTVEEPEWNDLESLKTEALTTSDEVFEQCSEQMKCTEAQPDISILPSPKAEPYSNSNDEVFEQLNEQIQSTEAEPVNISVIPGPKTEPHSYNNDEMYEQLNEQMRCTEAKPCISVLPSPKFEPYLDNNEEVDNTYKNEGKEWQEEHTNEGFEQSHEEMQHIEAEPDIVALSSPETEPYSDNSEEEQLDVKDEITIDEGIINLSSDSEDDSRAPVASTDPTYKKTRNRKFVCPVCKKDFLKHSLLLTHLKTHGCKKPFVCKQCKACFFTQKKLKDHTKSCHAGERLYKCTQCTKSFWKPNKLIRHLKRHMKERIFECVESDKTVHGSSKAMNHHAEECQLKSVNDGKNYCEIIKVIKVGNNMANRTAEREFQCVECGEICLNRYRLTVHIRAHKRPYECIECGKRFSTPKRLTNHWRTHTGDSPFECSECGEAFKASHALATHKKKHFGVKLLHCAACRMSFTGRAALISHVRTHSWETLQCGQCDKRFINRGMLNIHMVKSHCC